MCSTLLLALICAVAPPSDDLSTYFRIQVVDAETGRGVPLVELETVNHVRHVTDSNGLIAFHEPGLMGRDVYFHIRSHGYEFPKDGFGYRGKRLRVVAGDSATLRIKRLNVAQRLYRITGAGIYRDTILLGEKPPLKQPILNGQVFGSDSVVNAVFNDKIYWFWGDTNRPSYPLGNFHVPGATSRLPGRGGLDPDAGVDLSYFVDDKGFAKPTCKMPGKGPTWIGGLIALRESERQRLFATYVKVKPPLSVYERGLVEFNDTSKQFEHRLRFDSKWRVFPTGHPFHHRVNGKELIYFGGPVPATRVAANARALADFAAYETYSYLKTGSRAEEDAVDRDPQGKLRYAWRKQTPPLTSALENRLIRQGIIKADEAMLRLRDAETGKPVIIHSSSVAWNEYCKRWVMIALESFGTSALGEIWLASAEQPMGPWRDARKLVSHEKYSFYNPKQHSMFAKQNGRMIYFEATYTTMFSGNREATPRYDYNQIMYRVDLADARLDKTLRKSAD